MRYFPQPDRHGYRTLAIRNADMVFRLEDVIRGKNVRKWLLAAAYKCDWISRRFIEDPYPHDEELILDAVGYFLTRHCKEGVWARLNKSKTTVETTVIFAVTGSDIPVGGVRMIRVILVNAIELESVLTHPKAIDGTFSIIRTFKRIWRKRSTKMSVMRFVLQRCVPWREHIRMADTTSGPMGRAYASSTGYFRV